MKRLKSSSSKIKILIPVILVILLGVVCFLYYINKNDRNNQIQNIKDNGVGIVSKAEKKESDKFKESAQSSPEAEAFVNDTGGSAPPQSGTTPMVSKDAAITVYAPLTNSIFTSGSSLIGKASVQKVSYRLIDNVSGVTATGFLNVVSGTFSGKFSFSTTATEGRLDVFQTVTGGVEQSIIEIPVRFR